MFSGCQVLKKGLFHEHTKKALFYEASVNEQRDDGVYLGFCRKVMASSIL